MEKSRLLEYIVIIGSVVAIIILVFPFLFPIHLFDYEFYTVSKVSEIYKEDIFLSFHWKIANEIITGEPVESMGRSSITLQLYRSITKYRDNF